jgi:iron(III) transport system substrate-binding protein
LAAVLAFFGLMVVAWLVVVGRERKALVVYCAHDLVFAEQLLAQFNLETGHEVRVVGDTEVAKSLGLVQRIERERNNPICDVFWNNEPLGTEALAGQGLLEPYDSPEAAKRPAMFRDSAHRWTGFGLRYRVWIVNTEKLAATEEAIEERMNSSDLSRVAIAEPLYGTTLTHWTLLWKTLGAEALKKWHLGLKERGCHFVKGNGAVRDLVAAGTCDLGMTDTDDYFAALDRGAPVAMLPIRVEGKTIAIPNTVAVVKGTKRPETARKFVDYLLSANSELQLARQSGSRQAPIHVDAVSAPMPDDVSLLMRWTSEAADLSSLESSRSECLDWLLAEFAP